MRAARRQRGTAGPTSGRQLHPLSASGTKKAPGMPGASPKGVPLADSQRPAATASDDSWQAPPRPLRRCAGAALSYAAAQPGAGRSSMRRGLMQRSASSSPSLHGWQG